jgi:hypothetical protein
LWSVVSDLLVGIGRQSEGENAASTPLVCNAQGATVRPDDRVGNGQSHSSSMDYVPVAFTAIGFRENQALLGSIDSAARSTTLVVT